MCFVSGTKVHTKEGLKNIEDIQVGELVVSKDENTGNVSFKPVVQLFRNEGKQVYFVNVINSNGQREQIGATAEHPFWVEGIGWVKTENLRKNDSLITSDSKQAIVISIKLDAKLHTTYNFEVADYHTYFVGEGGVWVHNTCFGNLRDHVRRHALSGQSARQYYNSALKNTKVGFRFKVRHDGINKYNYVTRTGSDSFTFTSGSTNGSRIFTHIYDVNNKYLLNKGITLPKGF
jgi:intein/homing endonuclease